jgi:hypothetical protein
MIITMVPTKVLTGKDGVKLVVLQNQNGAGGANLLFGSQPTQLNTGQGTLVAPGGTTPQLTINEDLWVRGDTGNVQLRVI